MHETTWILLDTETTGLAAPIFVVELAAQRMRGWSAEGEPFRKLLNQNQEIPAEASRVHGYTREILERDGEQPHQVYREFAEYAGGLPLVSFNLEYDLDEVLKPEWKRLRISPIGSQGLCALRLAQRLLDPVPAGNCKLQTLRQYYRLPERGAHTALGDVQTVVDLFAQVLRPIAEHRGLDTGKTGGVCVGRMVSIPDCFWKTQRAVVSGSPEGCGTAPLAGLAGRFFQCPQRENGPLVFAATRSQNGTGH